MPPNKSPQTDMIDPPTEFRTERLLLRTPRIEDAESIFEEYAADPEVTRYLSWRPHKVKETVSEFLEGLIERNKAGEELSWILATPKQDRPLGMIVARIRGHKVELGYVLGRRHWNSGYMTEAISAISRWLLAQPGVFRVWAVCDLENAASARALEKCKFEREGVLRRWFVHPNRSLEPRDCYVYGRVR